MGLDPPYLGGREAQLERFQDLLRNPHAARNLLVTGLRGVGKTVLLNRYSNAAEAAGWLVAEREFSEPDAEPANFAQTVLADLVRLTRKVSGGARVRSAAVRAAQAVLEHLGTLSVSHSGIEVGVRFQGASHTLRRLDDDLRDALEDVAGLCRHGRHPGIVLRYDEFQVVHERRGASTLSALLTAVAGAQQRSVPVILVLCGLPNLLENVAKAKSYSERMFIVERLGNLTAPEDRLALTEPAEKAARTFDEAVVAAVLRDTAGYPFFIQMVPPCKRRVIRTGCNNPSTACRSRSPKLRAAWPWKRKVRVGAALTTTGRTGTTRRTGLGKQDGKVYESRNQRWNPLKGEPSSNLVDMGWATVRVDLAVGDDDLRFLWIWQDKGHGECLRRNRGEAVGEKLDTAPVKRHTLNMGTISAPPSPPLCQSGDGQARCRLMTPRWDGGSVVVRGWESQPHGEGTQQDRSAVSGMPGGRR